MNPLLSWFRGFDWSLAFKLFVCFSAGSAVGFYLGASWVIKLLKALFFELWSLGYAQGRNSHDPKVAWLRASRSLRNLYSKEETLRNAVEQENRWKKIQAKV